MNLQATFQLVGPPEVRWGNFKEVSAWGRNMDMVMVHGHGTLRSNGANSVGASVIHHKTTHKMIPHRKLWVWQCLGVLLLRMHAFALTSPKSGKSADRSAGVHKQPRTLRKEQHGLVAVEIVQTPISKQSCSGGPGIEPGRIDDLNTGGPGYDQHIKNRAARPWQAHRDGDFRS